MPNHPVQSTRWDDSSELHSGVDSALQGAEALAIDSNDAYKNVSRASRPNISRRLPKLEIVGRLYERQPGNAERSAEE